jgi:hypothetical protein
MWHCGTVAAPTRVQHGRVAPHRHPKFINTINTIINTITTITTITTIIHSTATNQIRDSCTEIQHRFIKNNAF